MLIIAVEPTPPQLRGRLVAHLRGAGGSLHGRRSARTWERIGEPVAAHVEDGDRVMVWHAPTDKGFDARAVGCNRRMPVDLEGLTLVSFAPVMKPDRR
jgi:CRISPR-associated protein Cas2